MLETIFMLIWPETLSVLNWTLNISSPGLALFSFDVAHWHCWLLIMTVLCIDSMQRMLEKFRKINVCLWLCLSLIYWDIFFHKSWPGAETTISEKIELMSYFWVSVFFEPRQGWRKECVWKEKILYSAKFPSIKLVFYLKTAP